MKRKKKDQPQEEKSGSIPIEAVFPHQYESQSDSAFFFTSERYIDNIDDADILEYIQSKYPALRPDGDESEQKKQIIQLVNDIQFVEHMFEWYNLNIFDLFSIMNRYFGNVFKGPFLKKMKIEMKDKTYKTPKKQHVRKARH